MRTWEHRIENCVFEIVEPYQAPEVYRARVVAWLDEIGAEGWQLVNVHSMATEGKEIINTTWRRRR